MRKILRAILSLLIVTLVASGVVALSLFSQTFPSVTTTTSTGDGLITTTSSTLFASTNPMTNGTSGNTQTFQWIYTVGSALSVSSGAPLNSVAPQSSSQNVFTIEIAGNFTPTFTITVSGTAKIVGTPQLDVVFGSIQGGAQFCSTPRVQKITSGIVSTLAYQSCLNGTSSVVENIIWYQVVVTVSSFGSLTIGSFNIVWNPVQ